MTPRLMGSACWWCHIDVPTPLLLCALALWFAICFRCYYYWFMVHSDPIACRGIFSRLHHPTLCCHHHYCHCCCCFYDFSYCSWHLWHCCWICGRFYCYCCVLESFLFLHLLLCQTNTLGTEDAALVLPSWSQLKILFWDSTVFVENFQLKLRPRLA